MYIKNAIITFLMLDITDTYLIVPKETKRNDDYISKYYILEIP